VGHWEALLEELIEKRRSSLVGYAYVLTGNLSDAEDLVHDAVVRTFAKPRQLTGVGHAEGYVRKAIATTFLNSRRKHRNFLAKVHLFVSEGEVADLAQGVSDTDAVRAAMLRLRPRERACVVLRYYEDLPIREIAETLGLADGSVKRYLADAVATLTRDLGPMPDFAGVNRDEPRVSVDAARRSPRRAR
jgi:RNA polymerase sigma factor (sigma-70 family)